MIRNNNNNQQNGRRRGRGGGQGGGGMGGAPRPQGQNFGNNRLDIRQRGNATQLLDKYKTLARDAAQQGDRVVSEYYLQYADHYFRVLNEIRERQPEHQRGPRPGYDADEDGDDVGNGYNPAYAAGNDAQGDGDRDDQGSQGQRYDQGQQGDRQPRQYEDRQQARGGQDGRRDDNRQPERSQQDRAAPEDRRDDGRRDDNRQPERQAERQPERAQQERGQSDGRQRDEYRRDRGESRGAGTGGTLRTEYRDAPRREQRDAAGDDQGESFREPAREAAPRDDEPILAGLPGPATLSGTPDGEAEPPKRRRGRPRKVVEAQAETAEA